MSYLAARKALIVGRLAIDVVSNARRQNVRLAGGSGLHAALASSLLAPTALVGTVGNNFPAETMRALRSRVDLSGVTADRTRPCNEWVGRYDSLDRASTDAYHANIPETTLGIPRRLLRSAAVLIGAMSPSLQLAVMGQLTAPAVVMIDTIRGFINREPDLVKAAIARADIVTVNEEEAQLLTGTSDVYLALDRLLALGPRTAIVKLGSNGAVMATGNLLFRVPALNSDPIDTTGAGDSFAGAFVGYLARQAELGRCLDNLAFGEALLMATVIASFSVEDFGSERLHTLTPAELFTRFAAARSSLLGQAQPLEIAGKLNGNVLLNAVDERTSPDTDRLIAAGYQPGAYSFDALPNGPRIDLSTFSSSRASKSKAMHRQADARQRALYDRYEAEIAKLDRSRFTYATLTETIMNVGRTIIAGDQESVKLDSFSDLNRQATQFGREVIGTLPPEMTLREWLTLVAAANALEIWSDKPLYQTRVQELKQLAREIKGRQPDLDASKLFAAKVWDRPTRVVYLPDNFGEVEIDLAFILKLAERYERSGADDWEIAIIPKALPVLVDIYHAALIETITDPASPHQALRRFLDSGKVKIIPGGSKSHGTNAPHLSREAADKLLEVKAHNGVVIAKGEAHVQTLNGLEIDTFLLFLAKSIDTVRIAGIRAEGIGVAFVPAGVKGFVGLVEGVRQNLADLQAALAANLDQSTLEAVKARALRTGETFVDALAKLGSSEPLNGGEKIAAHVLPIMQDPRVSGYTPVFIARAAMPFKLAWDAIARKQKNAPLSHRLMPKIGQVPQNRLSSLIRQLLTRTEAARPVGGETWRRLVAAFESLPVAAQLEIERRLGYPLANLAGRSCGELVDLFGNVGLDPRAEQAQVMFAQLAADQTKRPQDRDPELRARIKELHAGAKGRTEHLTRPLLNVLLAGTSFGRFVRKNPVLFIDEAGSTGSTVFAAELLVRSFANKARWKFYTVQPTKDKSGLYDGDCGLPCKPLENDPRLYDFFFAGANAQGTPRRVTYQGAITALTARLDPQVDHAANLKAAELRVTALLQEHYQALFAGITRLNSEHARAALKMIMRREQGNDPLVSAIAGLVIKEEQIPNHTQQRYAIKAELKLLADRLNTLLESQPAVKAELSALDREISAYDSIQTLKRWQRKFEQYAAEVLNWAKSL
ncbi:MAG: PfkB family carbohydrate kinase [Candidatus Margulisbacteria bacterium]|jgi:sugar/nucleoside kinase (ribokinase family)/uncharacterized protein with ATP-grasp and redox domains|nr:PfkB family carbohydrate kinase [Candidatus Margulisiibacteriota bacterium]